MVPAALLAKVTGTAWGLAIGRILTMLAGTASIALAGLLVRHRGRLAVVVACGICAVHPDAIFAAHTVLVEPWLVLFCLIGALALFEGDQLTQSRRRVLWAGVAFGFAGVVEAWAIVPVLVLLVLSAAAPRRAAAVRGRGRGRVRRADAAVPGPGAGQLLPQRDHRPGGQPPQRDQRLLAVPDPADRRAVGLHPPAGPAGAAGHRAGDRLRGAGQRGRLVPAGAAAARAGLVRRGVPAA